MTRRLLALCVAALGALALLVTPAAAQQSGAPQSGAQQSGAPDAYTHTADCLGRQNHLIVMTLIDESGSLQTNDPKAARVGAVASALGTLALFGRGPGQEQRPEMEVMVAGFGTDFAPGGWTPLNRGSIGTVRQQVAGFATRNTESDTDFAAALDGARKALADKEAAVVAAGQPRPCRLLLLFTDGVYDLTAHGGPSPAYAPNIPRTDTARTEDAGRHYLCDPDGAVDQLRKADTVIIAVGLVPQPPPPDGPPDQTFLRSIAQGDGQSCGRLTSPPGVHLTAEGIQALVDAFDNAIVRALGGDQPDPDPIPTPVCPATEQSPRCTRTFTLDRALSEFHLLVDLGAPGIVVDLTGPDGKPQRLRAGDDRAVSLSGADLQVTPASDVDIVIDGTLPPDRTDWAGTWTARFVDETGANPQAVSRSRLTVFGGLTPVVDPLPEFRVGERVDFPIAVVDVAGSPTTPSTFVRSTAVTAEIDGLGGPQLLDVAGSGSGGPYRSGFTVPADTVASTLDLKLTLDVVTEDGLRLRPKVKTYQLPVLPPTGFPLLAPTELTLGTITDGDEATGQITVTGSAGRGCVWFDGATFGPTPRDSGPVHTTFDPAATSTDTRTCVDPGQAAVITVHAAPDRVRTGLVEGLVTVRSTGTDPAKVHVTKIPVRFAMEQPVNQPFFWALFLALLLVGLLIPLVLLWLLNRLFARFEAPGSNLQRASLPVRVAPGSVTNTKTSLTPMPADLKFRTFEQGAAPVTRCPEFDDRILHFRRHVPLLPILLPFASVSTATRHVFASGGTVEPDAGTLRLGARRPWPPGLHVGRVPLAVAQNWVFVVERVEGDPARPDLPIPGVVGELTLYLPYGSGDISAPRVQELISDAVANLPPAVLNAADLRDAPVAEDESQGRRWRRWRRGGDDGGTTAPAVEPGPSAFRPPGAPSPTYRPPTAEPSPSPSDHPPARSDGAAAPTPLPEQRSHPAPAAGTGDPRPFIPPSTS